MHKQCGINSNFYRDYSRGKSFDFGVWNPHKVYLNDDYKQDFVSYENRLYACIKSNQNKRPTNESYWVVCVDTTFETIVSDNSFLVGNGLPEKSASNNSVYLDLDTNTFYRYVDKTWIVIGNIGQNNVTIRIDDEVSDTSENAIANKTIKLYVDDSLENAVTKLENYIDLHTQYKKIEEIVAPEVFLPGTEDEGGASDWKNSLYYVANSENTISDYYRSVNLKTYNTALNHPGNITIYEWYPDGSALKGMSCFAAHTDWDPYVMHFYCFDQLEIVDIQMDENGNAIRTHLGYLLNN